MSAVFVAPSSGLDPALARNVTSQFGEDGLIEALFQRIGIRHRWCFEVGAADGLELSNTWALRAAGWSALLIEADAEKFARLEAFRSPNVHCVHDRIGPDSLDRHLAACGAPLNLDLGVIDIDGEDVAVWRGLTRYRPRVMLVEFNPRGSGPLPGGAWQAGEVEVVALGWEKGYRPVARTDVNLLFVDAATNLSFSSAAWPAN